MSSQRRCRDCGREKPGAVVPLGASRELKLCLDFAANVCRWCHDRNLLAGGYINPRMPERWTEEEFERLCVEADRLAVERGAPWQVRRHIIARRETEKTQEALV